MVKSFKKVIACLLAVLMVVCAMPFTALAAAGDYEPDVQLVFSPVYTGGYFDYSTREGSKGYFESSMLYTAPLTFNQTEHVMDASTGTDSVTGTLSLDKAKTDIYDTVVNEIDLTETPEDASLEEDTQLGEGDYFAVTVLMDNVSTIFASQQFIQYSDNITPAGLATWTSGTGNKKKTYYALETVGQTSHSMVTGGESAVDICSAEGIYEGVDNVTVGNASAVDSEKRIIKSINTNQAGGNYADVSSVDTAFAFPNPFTGEITSEYSEEEEANVPVGYDFENTMICNTFIFKITGEGPITFSVYDTDNTKVGAFGAIYAILNKADGTGTKDYTTYAKNGEYAGSAKMTFFGSNINSGKTPEAPAECEHDYVYAPVTTTTHSATCKKDASHVLAEESCVFDGGVETKPATYTEAGIKTYTCTKCTNSYTEPINKLVCTDHEYGDYVSNNDATCTKDGTKTATCNKCGATDTVTDTGSMKEHEFGEYVSDNNATCTKDGTKTATCKNCPATDTVTDTGSMKNHTFKEYEYNNDATAKDNGTETAICEECKVATDTREKANSALGINVTVAEDYKSYGSVSGLDFGTTNVVYGETVTVTAEAFEGNTFVGWQIGKKLVSTDATYTYVAYKDITITPVFTEPQPEKITVIFYDKYNNVIADYSSVTVADFQAAMATALPTAPVYAGYKFAAWSMNETDIKALDTSATIWAYYDADEAQGFTVETTDDATLTVDEYRSTKVDDHMFVNVQFDTLATVTAPDATAWKVGETIVGYGKTYEFFVGSDIKVEPVYAAVEANPTVAMIKAYRISADSHKIMFLASMNVPEGTVLVDHGFVYGKNLVAEDLVVEKEGNNGANTDAGVVKKTGISADATEQFGISYGIKTAQGKACAIAFLTFIKNGEMKTIYSDAVEFDYATNNAIMMQDGGNN